MLYRKWSFKEGSIRNVLSVPFIWAPLVPILLTDLVMEIYHQVAFRLYDIPRVQRKNYIVFDRDKLKYLDFINKINCTYCAYVNGYFAYAAKIAAETERYWCGIKHQDFPGYVEPAHHKDFVEYGDEEAYRKTYNA